MSKPFRSLFRVLRSRQAFEDGMSDELRFHLEELTADLVRSGVPGEEAQRRAQIELGGLNTIKGNCRQSRGLHIVDECLREFHVPSVSLPALAGSALVIGAVSLLACLLPSQRAARILPLEALDNQ
jgi:hypothetical protein